MGTWGTALYANDTSCDVRDTYMKLLQEQLSNEEAYEKTLDEYREYIGDEEEPLFWYALAETQWRLGRLMPEVKEIALDWINKKGGIQLWAESKNKGIGWENTLQKLKTKLESPMPPEKVIKKPEEFIRNPWNIGDLYAYQFHSETSKEFGLYGKYIVFQKIGNEEWCEGWILSRVQIYDKLFDEVPILNDLEEVRILPFDLPNGFITGKRDTDVFPLCLNAPMLWYKKRDYSDKYFTFIGNQEDKMHYPIEAINFSIHNWKDMEWEYLCSYYQAWRNYDYEVKNGKAYVFVK